MPSELFEKKLREKLSQATIPPTPELWNNIEDQLKGGGRKRGIGIWILLVLLLLASMGAMWAFWHMNTSNPSSSKAVYAQQESLSETVSPPLDIPQNPASSNANIDTEETKALASQELLNSEETGKVKKKAKITANTIISANNQAQKVPKNSAHSSSSNNYSKQANTSDSETFTSAVLSQNLSEGLSSQVPQHTNRAQQESHILSEASSISSKEEIVEVAGLQQGPSLFLTKNLVSQGVSLPLPSHEFRKSWAINGYMDFHNDLSKFSFTEFGIDKSIADPLIEGLDVTSNNSDPYSYAGLNAPGNLIVYTPQKSLSFGLQAEWQFHPKFSLQSGLEYGSFSLGSYVVGIVADNTLSAPQPGYYNGLVSRRSTLFTYHQLGIPIQLNYRLLAKGRSSLQVYGGASLYAARAYSKSILQSSNFYDFAEANMRGDDGNFITATRNAVSDDVPELIQYNLFNLTLQGGFNYFYHLSDKSSIFFGPQLKFQATPIYREQQAEINEVPYYLGLRLGFRFAR